MRKRLVLPAALALCASMFRNTGNATGPFDQRLSPDQQILHALNRLTFGPRPGDLEDVRRIGVKKWIDLQLHPDQISENPVLAQRLQPLETVRMSAAEIAKQYTPFPAAVMMNRSPFLMMQDALSDEQRRKVLTGTAEERSQVLKALDPEKRRNVLAGLPDNVVAFTPEFKEEAEKARKEAQEERQAQQRKLNPTLRDLLSDDQLKTANAGDKAKIAELLASLDPDRRAQVGSRLPPRSLANFPEYRRENQKRGIPRLVVSEDAREAKVFRAIYSNRQLEEVLVDFWFNHFNVDVAKNVQQSANEVHVLIESYERDAIRPHVLGHFKDLLLATAHHPAMLYYLDNWESVAPNSFEVGPFAPNQGILNGVPGLIPSPLARQAHGLNENYGREIMELHTLGVKGGYTQNDVREVARCFTGWTIRDPQNPEFLFASFMHDFGEKIVLGHRIPAGGGEEDGLKVIDILTHHPSTARFISLKLARHFVADDPPPALVERMAQTFLKTDGDLRAVMETMFKSPEFFSEGAYQARVKSPLEMVVSTVRAMGAEVMDTYALVQKIADMGEPLYSKVEPNGYPDTSEAWLSTAGMMMRMNFPAAIASNTVAGVSWESARWNGKTNATMAHDLLGRDPSPHTLSAIENGLKGKDAPPSLVASLILSSPDFERR